MQLRRERMMNAAQPPSDRRPRPRPHGFRSFRCCGPCSLFRPGNDVTRGARAALSEPPSFFGVPFSFSATWVRALRNRQHLSARELAKPPAMELVSSSLERHIGYTSPSLNGAHLAEANGRWNPTYAKSLPFLGKDGAVPTQRDSSRKSARSSTRPASKLNKLSPPHSRPKALSEGMNRSKTTSLRNLWRPMARQTKQQLRSPRWS